MATFVGRVSLALTLLGPSMAAGAINGPRGGGGNAGPALRPDATQIDANRVRSRRSDGTRRGQIAEAARAVADRARAIRQLIATDPELIAAQQAFAAALLQVKDARGAVDRALRADVAQAPLVQAIEVAQQKLETLRKTASAGDRTLVAVSMELMNSRAAFSRVLSKAIEADDDCVKARYAMLDAHARLLDVQDKLLGLLNTDPELRSARQRLKEARSSR